MYCINRYILYEVYAIKHIFYTQIYIICIKYFFSLFFLFLFSRKILYQVFFLLFYIILFFRTDSPSDVASAHNFWCHLAIMAYYLVKDMLQLKQLQNVIRMKTNVKITSEKAGKDPFKDETPLTYLLFIESISVRNKCIND